MKYLLCGLYLFYFSFTATSQSKERPFLLSLFNNGTSLPGNGYAGVFSKTIHPGVCIGTSFSYKEGERSQMFQTAKLGYFYHRFAQHGIQLYSEFGYRYYIKSAIYAEGLIGAGYIHSIPDIEIFEFEDGEYKKKKNLGRPQLMISTGLSLGYDFEKKTSLPLKAFLLYQFWLQTPFVNKYVPLLPNTALHLGVIYKISL